jgi:ligand-binding sensor domain-containing protein
MKHCIKTVIALVLSSVLAASAGCASAAKTSVTTSASNNSTDVNAITAISTAMSPAQAGWTLFSSGSQINGLITKGNEIWAATTGGVEEWNMTTGSCRLYTIQDGLPGDYIYSITQDNRGNIWAATNFEICCFDGTKWTTVMQGLSGVTRIIADNSGNIWVFTLGGGVLRFDGKSWQTFSAIGGLPAVLIGNGGVIDLHGNFWVGIGGQGIARYDGQSWRIFTTADGLASNNVHVVFADRQGNIWCSTDQGGEPL